MAVSSLTDAQKRNLRDYIPALSDRTPGMDLYTVLANIISDLNNVQSGSATVALGDAAVVVALSGMDGKPVVAMLAETDGVAANHVMRAVWDGSDNLTITLSNNTTDDRTVFYIVDGR